MSLVIIDGSTGEGGGQILRTALSLSALLGRAVRIFNIRAGRKKPGLRPQHVQSVKAAAAICQARLQGVKEHSRELLFEPQASPRPGDYRCAIGTAGAATLVLQTILPPLSQAEAPSRITVQGGTHVAWSPPFDFLQAVYLPALAGLGLNATATLAGWGFYPKGGGEISLQIGPQTAGAAAQPPWAAGRGELKQLRILSASANVGNQVTARQAQQAYNRLAEAGRQPLLDTQLRNPRSLGPGSCLFLLAEYEQGVQAGFTGYGRRGFPAERVADEAVDAFLAHHDTGAAVDPYLTDQLMLPLALSGRSLTYTSSRITQHTLTNAWVIAQFMGQRFEILGQEGEPGQVRCLS